MIAIGPPRPSDYATGIDQILTGVFANCFRLGVPRVGVVQQIAKEWADHGKVGLPRPRRAAVLAQSIPLIQGRDRTPRTVQNKKLVALLLVCN